MKTGYSVADCMTENPLTTSPSTSIKECAKLMKKNRIGSIVITKDNKAVGILTNQDIVFRIVAEGKNTKKPVSDFMSTNIIKVKPNDDLFDALEVMNKNMIRHLSVCKNGELVGYLTLKDVLKIEPALFDLYINKIDSRMAGESNINPLYENDGICSICGNYAKTLYDVNGTKMCSKCKKDYSQDFKE